jgi:hypothetical protein
MAAGLSVDVEGWRLEFDELMLRVGTRFARVEPRRRMVAFVTGLLAGLPRVNCWSIAEHAGDAGPRGMQRLLSAAVWDEAGVRDDLRGYVLEHFADPGAVLVVDETGDLKKGIATRPGTPARPSPGQTPVRAGSPGTGLVSPGFAARSSGRPSMLRQRGCVLRRDLRLTTVRQGEQGRGRRHVPELRPPDHKVCNHRCTGSIRARESSPAALRCCSATVTQAIS